MLRDQLQTILSTYLPISQSTPFGKDNPVGGAFARVRDEFAASAPAHSRPTLRVKASYGKGNWSRVPWIAFLDERETTTTQHGVYPVILFAEDMSGFSLNLSQGVTETIKEYGDSLGKAILTAKATHLREDYSTLAQQGFTLDTPDKKLGKDYEMATAAYKFYSRNEVPTDNELLSDLSAMLDVYDDYLRTARPIYNPDFAGDICLIGAGSENPAFRDKALSQIATHGAWASWWSYPIAPEIQQHLRKPFYLYVSHKGQGINTRYKIAEFVSTQGSTGIKSPWPDATFPEERDHARFDQKDSGIAKTWFKIIERKEIDPPLDKRDFEPIKVAGRQSTELVLRNGFGYAIPKTGSNEIREPVLPASTYSINDALDGLFIEPEKFNEMVNTLTHKKNMILQGAPGVGKTFIAKRIAYAVIGEYAENRVEMIQFHQSYAYEDFIQGYRPNGNGFDLRNGVFHDFCLRAMQDPAHKYVFVIDEINRGNLSKIFGELMMLIEPDKRGPDWGIFLTYQDRAKPRFYVPNNVHLLGLMNTADRSIAMVDYALRRRFAFIEVEPGFITAAFRDHLTHRGASTALADKVVHRMQQLNTKIALDKTNLGPGFRIGHSFFCGTTGVLDEVWYQRVIQTEIAPLIREYWFDDTEQADAEIKQLLSA